MAERPWLERFAENRPIRRDVDRIIERQGEDGWDDDELLLHTFAFLDQHGLIGQLADYFDDITDADEDFEPEDDDDMEAAGPEDEDLVTADHRSFARFGMGDGPVIQVGEDEDWKAAVRAYCERQQFWPNIWWLPDHGNYHILSLDDEG